MTSFLPVIVNGVSFLILIGLLLPFSVDTSNVHSHGDLTAHRLPLKTQPSLHYISIGTLRMHLMGSHPQPLARKSCALPSQAFSSSVAD